MKNFKKTIKRIWGNLKWFFNHPPTSYTAVPLNHKYTCKYCPTTESLTIFTFTERVYTEDGQLQETYPEQFAVCHSCRMKAFDLILLTDNTQSDSQD